MVNGPLVAQPGSMSSRLLLVDGHAYAYRAFYAIRSLNSPEGAPTNAIFGFVKMLTKLELLLQPTHRLVVWDAGLAAERLAALPDYKAQRPPTPEALASQLPQLADWLIAAGWASHEQEGFEADDWIGTYARRAEAAGWHVVIASSDKDFQQLVTDRVGLFNPSDKSEKVWAASDVEAKIGVTPSQVVDWLALVGDAVDNIPGVPGVGPKTATDLLKRFGSIDALLAGVGTIKHERLRQELEKHGDVLRRNQLMVRLFCDLEGGPDLPTLEPRTPQKNVLREMYRRWGFRSLLNELGEVDSPTQTDLF